MKLFDRLFGLLILGLLTRLCACAEAQATVLVQNNSVSYACNGTQAAFQINFPFQSQGTIYAYNLSPGGEGGPPTQTLLVNGTDYVINLSSALTTATLTLLSPSVGCANTHTLFITRSVPYEQTTSFITQGQFYPAVFEMQFDDVVYQIQQLANGGLDGGFSGIATSLGEGALKHDATITGDGTVSTPLGVNLSNSNTWTVNQIFGSTELVKGLLTADGGLNVNGNLSVAGGADIANDVEISSNLQVDSDSLFQGQVEIQSLLLVDSTADFGDNVLLARHLLVDGGVLVNGVGGQPAITAVGGAPDGTAAALVGDVTITGELLVTESGGFEELLFAESDLLVGGDAGVVGNLGVGRSLIVDGGAYVNGAVYVDGGVVIVSNQTYALSLYANTANLGAMHFTPAGVPSGHSVGDVTYVDGLGLEQVTPTSAGAGYVRVPQGRSVTFSSSATATFTVESGSTGCVCNSTAHPYLPQCVIASTTATITSGTSNSDIWSCTYW